jgi:cupin 2 domain-containing protein
MSGEGIVIRNLLETVDGPLDEERVDELVRRPGLRVERIVSRGHASPPGFWYDQSETEWVLLVAGRARLAFADGRGPVELGPGDWLEIPARARHRVEWTEPGRDTVWLAIFSEPVGG